MTFFYWGKYYKYHVPEIENMKCAKVQVSIKAWKNRTGNEFLYYLGLNRFTYQKMHVDKWKDIPNRFNSGDVITIDGDKGKFYVNGMNRQQDEILGTQYFKVDPGTSEIKFRVSEWTKTDPTIKVYIREAWL
ncbi:Phage-related protein [Chlamydia trachomatis]|nr:Phage-related protein [Chlamydia trachomatis]